MASPDKVSERERFAFKVMIWEKIFDTLRLVIKWVGMFGVAWIVYLCIKELAGQLTVAHFVLEVLKSEPPTATTIWSIIAGIFGIWAWIERKLRHLKVKYLSNRVQQLEKGIDPKRSTSGLAPTGQTHPKDKLP